MSLPEVPSRLIIVGAGGHATSVAGVALAVGLRIECFVDAQKAGASLLGIDIVADVAARVGGPDCGIAVAIGDNAARERVWREILACHRGAVFPTLVHPTAVVSAFSSLGEGSVMMPNSVVGPNTRVGRFCIVNTLASVDHDCEVGDFASLAPGARTGGRVSLGDRSVLGLSAVVQHGTRVGADALLGANSYLRHDLDAGQVAWGNPAKPVRARAPDEPYL